MPKSKKQMAKPAPKRNTPNQPVPGSEGQKRSKQMAPKKQPKRMK